MVAVNMPESRRARSSVGWLYKSTVLCLLISAVALSISTIFLSLRVETSAGKEIHTITPPNELIEQEINRHLIGDQQNVAGHIVKGRTSFNSNQDVKLGSNKNSDVYQPVRTGKRLLTYKRFGGRLNNQLFQFITALQHAKVLKRTFVVPDEVREVDWTGMFDTALGIWDIDRLNAAYDIDWRSGLSLDFQKSIPNECVLTPKEGRQLLKGGPGLWEEWDRKCPDIIDIAGNTGLLFCEQQHQFCGDSEAQMEAYQIYSHFSLSPSLLQHIPSKKEEFKGKGYNELAIHSRRAGEGMYDWEVCVKGNSRTCRGHITSGSYCDVRTMKGNCAIWLDLDYQIKSKKFLKENLGDYRFVLASDGTHDWNLDYAGQFIVANNADWLRDLEQSISSGVEYETYIHDNSVSSFARSRLSKSTLDTLTATLLDLFSLVDSKYFLGGYYSTLSLNACFLRGLERKYDSNMCWMLMHPSSKYAAPPPDADVVHFRQKEGMSPPFRTGQIELPPALMSDVEHAFVTSNDGNFIAIDRYIIDYKKRGLRRTSKVIGVLGDGLVPLTIETDENGEETIRADFQCSYGGDSSPATIIMMKGDKSYHEHYYERGVKYNWPFSTNGDRFRTMLILCEELIYDKSLSRHPPLILSSDDGQFHLRIGSSFARPISQPKKRMLGHAPISGDKDEKKKVVHCLNPTYGLKNPKWLIEYFEYHIAAGVDHFHVYNVDMHSLEVQNILEKYRQWNLITRHDWSAEASNQYTTRITYEHAKWAAQTDCALRSRGLYDYALFTDIDEVVMGGSMGLVLALELCEKAHSNRGVIGCSFNSNTVSSIFTKLTEDEEKKVKDKLLLERYSRVERKPFCPSNCKCLGRNCEDMTRKYHYGRQKYMLKMNDLSNFPRPLWTHAISRDYEEMDRIMEQLPDNIFHIRHYQGHWLKNNNLLDTMEEKSAPLPKELIEPLHASIFKNYSSPLLSIYARISEDPKFSGGVEWVAPIERPAKYHDNLIT